MRPTQKAPSTRKDAKPVVGPCATWSTDCGKGGCCLIRSDRGGQPSLKPEASQRVAGGWGAQRRHHRRPTRTRDPASRQGCERREHHPFWQPSGLPGTMGIGSRWCRSAQPPATSCETSGFGRGASSSQSLGNRDVIPLHGTARILAGRERIGPLDRFACDAIRTRNHEENRGRDREPPSRSRLAA